MKVDAMICRYMAPSGKSSGKSLEWPFLANVISAICPAIFTGDISVLTGSHASAISLPDIAGTVAAMTESERGVESERTSHDALG